MMKEERPQVFAAGLSADSMREAHSRSQFNSRNATRVYYACIDTSRIDPSLWSGV